MRLIVFVIFMVLCFGCAPKDAQRGDRHGLIEGTDVTVTISAQDGGLWRADYVFAAPQTAMILSMSLNDYRSKTWKSLDAGARFERVAGFDAFLFDEPTRAASFVFAPYTGKVRREYSPFIVFSDGGLAVYTGQFEALAVQNRNAIEKLQGSMQNWQGQQGTLGVRVLSDKPMIKDGSVVSGEAIDIISDGGTYIYVGDASITTGTDFAGVIDPGLPEWLRVRFDADLSKIYNGYRELWGEGLSQKSTVIFAFLGYGGQGFSNKGGALGSMLALQSSGPALRAENMHTLQGIHWFFAHEVAHIFQTRGGDPFSDSSDAWISEGGANAMANILLRHQGLADNAYIFGEYGREYKECRDYLKTAKLADSIKMGQFNIHYACGDIMMQITNGALPNHNLFAFWDEMLKAARQQKDYSSATYFAVMEKLGAPEHIINGLRRFANEKIDDPKQLLKDLMVQSGLEPKFNDQGHLISLQLP